MPWIPATVIRFALKSTWFIYCKGQRIVAGIEKALNNASYCFKDTMPYNLQLLVRLVIVSYY